MKPTLRIEITLLFLGLAILAAPLLHGCKTPLANPDNWSGSATAGINTAGELTGGILVTFTWPPPSAVTRDRLLAAGAVEMRSQSLFRIDRLNLADDRQQAALTHALLEGAVLTTLR